MKQEVFDKKGKVVETINISDNVFGAKIMEDLLAQYVRVYSHNQRQGTSSTKDRSEVSGGGKKPWRQKGSGRARHGSIRSPLWRTGGVTHGPKPKSWNLSFPKKMKAKAMISALSAKKKADNFYVLDKLEIKEPKTKEISTLLSSLKLPRKSLIVLSGNDTTVYKSGRNIEGLNISAVDNVSPYEVLNAKCVLVLKDAVKKLEEKYETR